jgi:AcrR family transcriptional regulator
MDTIKTSKPQQARSEETRARILEVALELFAQNGYEATGVAEICDRCQLSKGAFYHHFASKQAVFLELMEQWLGGLEREMGEVAARAASVPEALQEMTARLQAIMQLADGRLSFFLEFWTQARRDPLVWKRTIRPFRQYQRLFAMLIQKGIDEGSFRQVDTKSTAHALVSMAVGLLLQSVVDPESEAWSEVTARSVDLFIQALHRRTP